MRELRNCVSVISLLVLLAQSGLSLPISSRTAMRFEGFQTSESVGWDSEGAGDFNGDGFSDFLVGAERSVTGGVEAGAVYVIFGSANPSPVLRGNQLNGTNGFRVHGHAGNDVDSRAVAACDLNADGKSEVLVLGSIGSGVVYAILGRDNSPASLSLANLDPTNSIRLVGPTATRFDSDLVCFVAQGQLRPSVVIGVPNSTSPGGGFRRWDVPQPPIPSVIDGATFSLTTGSGTEALGGRTWDFGDVNDDGIDDLGVATERHATTNNGAIYVSYGRSDGAGSQLNVVIHASGASTQLGGWGASKIGDFNGDGINDFAFGEPTKDLPGPLGTDVGVVYVVFGKIGGLQPIDLGTLEPALGIKIAGQNPGDRFGMDITFLGDVNDDGFVDFGVGASSSDFGGSDAGSFYVIYGGAALGPEVAVGDLLGTRVLRLDGDATNMNLGLGAGYVGDFNGDAVADFIIGARGASFGGAFSGAAYLVLGTPDGLFADGFEGA